MKLTQYFVLALLVSQQSYAAFGYGTKYSTYPDDDDVQYMNVKANESGTLMISGITYDGKFRLQEIAGVWNEPLKISGSKIQKLGLEGFLQDCERNRKLEVFEVVQDQGNIFTLEGPLLAVNRQTIANLLPGLQDETLYTGVNYSISLDDSILGSNSKAAGTKARLIKRAIEQQIEAQKEDIWATGRVRLNLSGQDAFVCDLLSRGTELRLGASLSYARPLPVRESAITPQELATVVQKMENRQVPIKTARDGIAINAILQNDAFKEVLNKDAVSFESSNFLKIANSLVDGGTGKLIVRPSDRTRIRSIARSLDKVDYREGMSDWQIRPTIQVK